MRRDAGLCATCRHARAIATRRGARYLLCRLSETDPAFARYPRLPVLRCDGHAPANREPGDRDPGRDRA